MFTLAMLTFGKHVDLATRCLTGITTALRGAGRERVRDLRIGVNTPEPELVEYLRSQATMISELLLVPVRLYIAHENKYKYPLMRRMIREPEPAAEYFGWLDDDAVLTEIARTRDWWEELEAALVKDHMVGKQYRLPLKGNQWLWIEQQPWYRPEAGFAPPQSWGSKNIPTFTFCQGSCWFTATRHLLKLDWPAKDLRHCGGDSLLGEAYRQQGWTLGKFESGIWFNADWQGNHSKMPRRGYSEPECGRDYRSDVPIDHSHHDFEVQVEEFLCPVSKS